MNQMNLGSQSISNDSQNFNDYRYQKALKQISKLINVNRQIKLQSERYRQQIQQQNAKLQEYIEHNTQLQNQVQQLHQQLQHIHQSYQELENYCKQSEFQQKQLIRSNELELSNKMEVEKKHTEEIYELESQFREQMNQFIVEINTKDQKINQLQEKLSTVIQQLQQDNTQIQHKYQEKAQQCAQLVQRCQSLQSKIQELSQNFINTPSQIKQLPNEDLINKLKINEEWIKSLNEQNYNLKQKVLEQQYKRQREKCNQSILHNIGKDTTIVKQGNLFVSMSTKNANELLIKDYLKQVQKKIKKVEDEKNKSEHKYEKLRHKYHQLEGKVNHMEKENNLLTVKISGYQQLTERQQKQIQTMIEEYHAEMDRILKSKKKIKSEININDQAASTVDKEKQLKTLIANLQEEISKDKIQSQEKDKFIKYLQTKIQALEDERIQIQKTNCLLEQELASYNMNNMDLSKTSKNYNKTQNVHKNSVSKNLVKVNGINGKKLQGQMMKQKQSPNRQDDESQVNISKESLDFNQGKKFFPTGEISYVSSQRSYDNPIEHSQRA